MDKICVKMPDKVYYSDNPDGYIVKNDFFITVYKENLKNESCSPVSCNSLKGGEAYPTIYIKGFEQLFKDDGTRDTALNNFFSMFNTCGNKDWEIMYGKFRRTDERCAVITCTNLELSKDFTVSMQLSDKCSFTEKPQAFTPIKMQVYVDDFDIIFDDVQSRIEYSVTIERGAAVYIENFGAYTDRQVPVSNVYKGETCNISWRIASSQKASALLYDENGCIVANLPPYKAVVDKDRKFILTAYNDFCSVTQILNVYRTLWKKSEAVPENCPKTDKAGHYKLFERYDGKYLLYVHPNLYCSDDLCSWSVLSENKDIPAGFTYYHSSYSDSRMCVCYTYADKVSCHEYSFVENVWEKCTFERKGLLTAQALLNGSLTQIILSTEKDIGIYDLQDGALINASYMFVPDSCKIRDIDTYYDKHSFMAVLCSNKRVYFYDFDDGFKDNIFECPDVKDDFICIVKSNALYAVTNGYTIEVSDREKFSDFHFFPSFSSGTKPIIGGRDNESITAIIQSDSKAEIWEHRF